MPIIRYFVFVGGLLFAADRYLPAPVQTAPSADLDRTTIRISSARSLPERIVFDTRPRTDVAKVAQANPIAEAPQEQVRQAMAAVPAAPPAEIKKEPPARVSAGVRPRSKRSAQFSKRAPERRLAFDRHEPFAGGWW